MFKKDDAVLYGKYGVCRIESTQIRNFGQQSVEYYVLRPVFQGNSTVYVPTSSESLVSKMRPLTSEQQIMDAIGSTKDHSVIFSLDDQLRREEYRRILNSGDRAEAASVVSALIGHKRDGRFRLHKCDEYFLETAKKLLDEEFAFVLNIRPEQVDEFVSSRKNA